MCGGQDTRDRGLNRRRRLSADGRAEPREPRDAAIRFFTSGVSTGARERARVLGVF